MQQEEVHLRTAKIWLGDDGIIRKIFHENAEETLQDALESGEVIQKISKGVKRQLIVDFSPVRSMDSDARQYYAKASIFVSAVGGVTKSMLSRVIGNFFMGFNRNQGSTPGRLFGSEEEAIKWLKQFL